MQQLALEVLQALAEMTSSTVCILMTSIYRLSSGDATMVAVAAPSSPSTTTAPSAIMPSVVDAESVWNAILQSPSVVSVYTQY